MTLTIVLPCSTVGGGLESGNRGRRTRWLKVRVRPDTPFPAKLPVPLPESVSPRDKRPCIAVVEPFEACGPSADPRGPQPHRTGGADIFCRARLPAGRSTGAT